MDLLPPASGTTLAVSPNLSRGSGFDHVAAADQQAIGNEAERGDIDLASALVDQLDKPRVDVGIFTWALEGLALAIDRQQRTAVFKADFGPLGSADGDRPFLALGPAP